MPHRHFWRCGTRRSVSVPGRTGRSLTFESLHLTRRRQRHSGAFTHSRSLDLHQKSARDRTRLVNDTPPPLPPLRALAPPPRLRAKHASSCALCAGRPGPASTSAVGQKRRLKNCANLCVFLHFCYVQPRYQANTAYQCHIFQSMTYSISQEFY